MITLYGGWQIESDPHCYMLVRITDYKGKDGKDKQRRDIRGYYGTLSGALKAAVEEIVRDKVGGGSYSLREAVNIISAVRDDVHRLIEQEVGDV